MCQSLKKTLEEWEGGEQRQGGAVENAWSQLIAMRQHEEKVARLLAAVSHAHDTFSTISKVKPELPTFEALYGAFTRLDYNERERFARKILGTLNDEQQEQLFEEHHEKH